MTPRERAAEVARTIGSTAIWAEDAKVVESAIRAAVAEDRASRECCKAEREACAKVADEMVETFKASVAERAQNGEAPDAIIADYSGATGTAHLIACQIRARSTTDDSPPCARCGLRFSVSLTREGYCHECAVIAAATTSRCEYSFKEPEPLPAGGERCDLGTDCDRPQRID